MPVVINGTTGIVNNATDLNYTGTLTGGTGVVNFGSGQFYKDASGNVGIGTSSPSSFSKLAVTASSGVIGNFESTQSATNVNLLNLNATQTNSSSGIRLQINSGTTAQARIQLSGDNAIVFQQTSSDTERARIDSSGSFLVGTTSPASNVGGFQVSYNPGSGKFAGAVVNTKTDNSTVTQGFLVKYTGVSPSDGNYIFLCQDSGNTNRFFVTNAGGTGGTSDAALKKNIETTRDGYVNDLCKIRIVKYNWKTQDDNAPKYLGWIAQEVEEVFPRMVETDPKTGFKSVTYSPFVPMLIKAVQEQQALIESLTARIAALEAK